MGLFIVPGCAKAITLLVGQILMQSEIRHRQGEVTEFHLFHKRPKLAGLPWPTGSLPEVMGDGTATLRVLIREYLFVSRGAVIIVLTRCFACQACFTRSGP